MALTPSGTISLGDINTATGKSATAPISMSGTAVRGISNTTLLTAVSMSQLRNKNCAGGTITVGTRTVTGKGTTNISYGYSGSTYGSITQGNITTYPGLSTVTGIPALNVSAASNQSPPYSSWAGSFNFNMPASPGTLNGRVRVGDNDAMPLVSTVTYVAGTFVNSLSATTPLGAMVAGNVGQTLDWVIVAP